MPVLSERHCHQGMARPQVADGGTASNMEGGREYIKKNSREQPTRSGPPAWGLAEVLTTPQRRNLSCYESFIE